MLDELVEFLADIQHLIWAHWMRYLFSVCKEDSGGALVIPPELVECWRRQMQMQYDELSEEEKASDRRQAAKLITYVSVRLSK